jgi:hypothetical protein
MKLLIMAAWYNAGIVFTRLNTGIVGSNPTRDTDVCLRLVLCLYCPV